MITSTSFSSTIRHAQPKFGQVDFSTDAEGKGGVRIQTTGKVELDSTETDDVVTFNHPKIGTSQTAKLLSEQARQNKLSVTNLKKGLLKILGPYSDLDTASACTSPTWARVQEGAQTSQELLQKYKLAKDTISQRLQEPDARLYNSKLGPHRSITIGGQLLGLPIGQNDTTHFSGRDRSKFHNRNNARDKEQAQREEDKAFLDSRTEWYANHRPEEDATEGYVTTPGHGDDESRPSARRRAKETRRTFDSRNQSFRKKVQGD